MGHLANEADKHDNTMQNYDSFFTRDGGSTAKYLGKLYIVFIFLSNISAHSKRYREADQSSTLMIVR